MSIIRCRQCGQVTPSEAFPTGEFKCPACDWSEVLSAVRMPSLDESGPQAEPEPEPEAVAVAVAVAEADEPHDVETPAGNAEVVEPADEPADESGSGADDADPLPPATTSPAEAGTKQQKTNAPDEGNGAQTRKSAPSGVPFAAGVDSLRELEDAAFVEWAAGIFGNFGYDVRIPDDSHERDCDLVLIHGGEPILVDCRRISPDDEVLRAECQRLVGAMAGCAATRGILITTGRFSDACRAYVALVGDVRIDLIDGAELSETLQAISEGPLRKWWPAAA